jgi:adenylate cyclase
MLLWLFLRATLDRAVDAALAVRDKINNPPAIEGNLDYKPKVSIGIKSGEIISENIESISLKHLYYSVIGDTFHTASRLQNAVKENQIIISDDCYKNVKESFKFKKQILLV